MYKFGHKMGWATFWPILCKKNLVTLVALHLIAVVTIFARMAQNRKRSFFKRHDLGIKI
jgi:hypothetical protein